LLVDLIHISDHYVGRVKLNIPEPKNYRRHAHLKGDIFTMTLNESGSSKVIASDDEEVNGHIDFILVLPLVK